MVSEERLGRVGLYVTTSGILLLQLLACGVRASSLLMREARSICSWTKLRKFDDHVSGSASFSLGCFEGWQQTKRWLIIYTGRYPEDV